MKTTVEIPDEIFARAKAQAARRGQSLKRYLNDALVRHLGETTEGGKKPWMAHFGCAASLSDAIAAVDELIDSEFGTVDPDDWK